MVTLSHVIGHRGAASVAPENTLAGVRAAADVGARWVEFDVRLTCDNRCVLLHDDTLKRTAGLRRRLDSATLAEIADLDAGSWFDTAFSAERIPTLEATLDLVSQLGMGANIEIKPDPPRTEQVARTVVDIARSYMSRMEVLISSLDEKMLEAVRRLDPKVPLGLVLRRRRRAWRDISRRLDLFSLSCRDSWIRRRDVDVFHEAGLEVMVFTVNHPSRAAELIGWGVAGVFSDAPGNLIPKLAAQPECRVS